MPMLAGPMLKLTVRHLLEKKIRFALTTLTVVLGVMFVVGSFVLTDSLRAVFTDLADDIAAGVDLTVRTKQEVGGDFDRPTLPDSLVAEVGDVDGVQEVYPSVGAFNVVIVDGEGEPIVPPGPPSLGFNFTSNQLFLTEGSAEPEKPGEFAVDTTTAADNGLLIGETYAINGPISSERFKLVGTFNFGSPEANNSVGQTMAAFELETAQKFLGFGDQLLDIGVSVSGGIAPEDVKERIEAGLGDAYEVITQETAAEEQRGDFDQVITIFGTILLVFAFISVFVSAFIINNTFQIILGQRVRELGLWRAVGATPKQVTRSVLVESTILGLLSTVIGTALGMLLSVGLRAALRALGFGLPSGPLELHPRTLLLAALVGMGVTMTSSVGPAVRARRVSPVDALMHGYSADRTGLHRRLIAGGMVTAVGMTILAVGMFADIGGTVPTLTAIGAGALAIFVGINMLSPAFAQPVAGMLGKPVLALLQMPSLVKCIVVRALRSRWSNTPTDAALNVPSQLARNNAARDPRRTASTAGALMIGLALVGLTAVVGASMKKTFVDALDNAVQADYFIRSTRSDFDPGAGFPAQAADDIAALKEFDSVVRYRFGLGSVQVADQPRDVLATEFASVEDHLDGDVRSGGFASADPLTSVALHTDPAEDLGVGVGDTLEMTFPDNETETLTVAAVYADAALYGNWVIDLALWDEHFVRSELAFVSATVTGFSDDLSEVEQTQFLESSREAIDEALEEYPTVRAENRVEFRQSQQSQLDSFLSVITVFLGLALVIALVGIANTLALSVFERTREIGLLRAVGMTRPQLRKSIRWEAAIVAVFGALLGVTVGTVLGVAAVAAIPDSIVRHVDVPVVTLAVYVLVAAMAGLVAAIGPAFRAGRMNVLDAIAENVAGQPRPQAAAWVACVRGVLWLLRGVRRLLRKP